MNEFLLATANITIEWAGPWIFPSPEYPAPTVPALPVVPAPIPMPTLWLPIIITLVAIIIIASLLVWWYGYRKGSGSKGVKRNTSADPEPGME